jgi:hypothetical protein
MANKRAKRLIKSARKRKKELLGSMTPKQRKEYEQIKRRRKEQMYNTYDYKLSFKENLFVVLMTIVALAVLCGFVYLIYLAVQFVLGHCG